MKKKQIFIILGTMIVLIVVIVLGKLWIANHIDLFCDSFSGGYSNGWTYSVDGYASGTVFTFVDANENQIFDAGETPLPFVSGESDNIFFVTNKDGKFETFTFKPGCCNKCWKDSSFFVNVPLGYKPTTPVYYELTSNNATFNIGFVQVEQVMYPEFINRFPWIAAFVNNGLIIKSFGYKFDYASCCVLILEFDPKETIKNIDFEDYVEMNDFLNTYVYKVVDSLNNKKELVNQLQLKILPIEEMITCVRTSSGWTTATVGDTVSNKYCEVPKY